MGRLGEMGEEVKRGEAEQLGVAVVVVAEESVLDSMKEGGRVTVWVGEEETEMVVEAWNSEVSLSSSQKTFLGEESPGTER